MTVEVIDLPSGRRLQMSVDRLRRFLDEEYDYYDAVASPDPTHITPMDVLVTVSVNSFVNDAAKVRRVHRGLAAACDQLLAAIPTDADLRDYDLVVLRDLLHAAVQPAGVLIAVATKVLHRKRPALVPMLDSVLIGYYAGHLGLPRLVGYATGDKKRAADAAAAVLDAFRTDLIAASIELEAIRADVATVGYKLTDLRILELLLWMDCENRGYYR